MRKAPSSTDNEAETPALSVVELEDEITQITDKYEQLLQSYDSLQHQLKQFQRHRFGQRSETYVDPNHPPCSMTLIFMAAYRIGYNPVGEMITLDR